MRDRVDPKQDLQDTEDDPEDHPPRARACLLAPCRADSGKDAEQKEVAGRKIQD